jgi:hypothetical protein
MSFSSEHWSGGQKLELTSNSANASIFSSSLSTLYEQFWLLLGFKVMADNHLSGITLKPIFAVFTCRDSGLGG